MQLNDHHLTCLLLYDQMNKGFFESCRTHQLTVEVFQPIYCATKHWTSAVS